MKFQRKPGSVEVGLLSVNVGDGMPPLYGQPPPEPKAVILNEIGRAFAISIALLESEYEPADEDAKAWLAGVRERVAAPAPPPYPYEPGDLEMEFQTDPDSPPQKFRMGAVKRKRSPAESTPGYRFDRDKLPAERPEWWPASFPWPPPNGPEWWPASFPWPPPNVI